MLDILAVFCCKCNPASPGSRSEIMPFFFIFVSFTEEKPAADTISHISDTISKLRRIFFFFARLF